MGAIVVAAAFAPAIFGERVTSRIHGMILAAGFGTRLRPLTDRMPKPIIEVGGQPLIFFALQNMQRAGATRVVINTHHLAEQVERKVRTVEWPFEVLFSHEPKILGTGGAIKSARSQFASADAILVQNADAIIDIDVRALLENHLNSDALATMVLRSVEDPDKYGAVVTDAKDQVKDIIGKVGYVGEVYRRRMFCGMQVFRPSIMSWMPDQEEFCILREVLIPAIQKGAIVRAFEQTGYFCDVGTPERLLEANAHFAQSNGAVMPAEAGIQSTTRFQA